MFFIKQADTLPVLQVVVSSGGVPIDLRAVTSKKFRMRLPTDPQGSYVVNRDCDFVTTGQDGALEFAFTESETANAGSYIGEFVVAWDTDVQTVPGDDYIAVIIKPTL